MTRAVQVIVRDGPGHTLVAPQGPLYYDTVAPLRDALLLLAAADRPHLVLDLSSVPVCDSSGLNLLVQAHRLAERRDGWLRLVAPQPNVARVLEITNLDRLLAVYGSVSAAAAG